MIAQTEILYPVLKYNGGKFRLREWIVSHFPEHYTYVETCLGAGSVLLNKKRSKWEVANDIDGMIHNFFEVLRDRPYQLISRIRNTPYSEEIFEELLHSLTLKLNAPSYHDPVKTAWEYYCICWMSMQANNIRKSNMRKYKPTFRSKGNMGTVGGHNPARIFARTEHPLYDHVLCEEHGWTRVDIKTLANCMVADVDIEKKRRIEVLYISPRAQTQPKLF